MSRVYGATSLAVAAAIVGACETSPPAPSVIPGPFVAAVATRVPGVWDSRTELAGWVDNGISTMNATVDGDGDAGLLRVDVGSGNVTLHGPDTDPFLSDVETARVRFRWIGAESTDSMRLSLHLRPVEFGPDARLAVLTRQGGFNFVEDRSGAWLEKQFGATGTSGPFSVRYLLLTISRNSSQPIHGTIEIDWIALER